MNSRISGIALIALLAGIAGCSQNDPLTSERVWHPNHVNADNIAAQVANPADLLHGREPVGGSDGELAAAAIQRLRTDHVKKLPDTSITDMHMQPSGSSAGGS